MTKYIAIIIILLASLISCKQTERNHLFDGNGMGNWQTSGTAILKDSILIVEGTNSKLTLNNGNYKDFDLRMKLRTVNNGKGYITFHSDGENKGYNVAINNDFDDQIWWRMTGSLVSVRNLTKSLVKDGEWFDMNIRVEGQSISVLINGELVVEYIEPEKPFRKSPYNKCILSEGTFEILSRGEGSIEIKDIYVEPINREDINIPAQLALAREGTERFSHINL